MQARGLGLKIMQYKEFAKILKAQQRQRKGKSVTRRSQPPAKKVLAVGLGRSKIIRLVEPFVKIEDRARQFRPLVEPLEKWPKINLRPGIASFLIFF